MPYSLDLRKKVIDYVVWEENDVVPILTLEVVSQTPGGEYDEKMVKYANLGVFYYVIYNPHFWQRDRREPLEVYRWESGEYVHQLGEPLWMEEIGLGIGRGKGIHKGMEREWLYWFNEQGKRLITLEEKLARYQELFGELPD